MLLRKFDYSLVSRKEEEKTWDKKFPNKNCKKNAKNGMAFFFFFGATIHTRQEIQIPICRIFFQRYFANLPKMIVRYHLFKKGAQKEETPPLPLSACFYWNI